MLGLGLLNRNWFCCSVGPLKVVFSRMFVQFHVVFTPFFFYKSRRPTHMVVARAVSGVRLHTHPIFVRELRTTVVLVSSAPSLVSLQPCFTTSIARLLPPSCALQATPSALVACWLRHPAVFLDS